MLIDLLTSTLDGVLLVIEQVFHQRDQLDLAPLIHAIPRTILCRAEKAKLAFPVSQNVRLQAGEIAHLADREEFLHWFGCWAHWSCSDRSSRAMSSGTASRAAWPSNSMRCTIRTMGMSTPCFAARARALAVVVTPSATVSFPSSAAAS